MTRYLFVLLAMAAVIAAPMILRPAASVRTEDYAKGDRLVIITPHVETLRYEIEHGFSRWMQEKHGRRVVIDWRVPGGTSDIVKVVTSEYTAAFHAWWQKERRGSPAQAEGFLDSKSDSKSKSSAREAWLGSNVSSGFDLMLGGGPQDYDGLKKAGFIVSRDASGKFGPAAVKTAHPDWFTDAAIPASVAGQTYYDPDLAWIGTCLSAFGICWNKENLERRGIKAPAAWTDLADPAFENQLAVSDPTKSGTVAAMFECILQVEIAAAVKRSGQTLRGTVPANPAQALGSNLSPEGLARLNERLEGFDSVLNAPRAWTPLPANTIPDGWSAGLQEIRAIGANARYWTDSSTKIPLDVSEGEALAGMCVDFYGRNLIERLTKVNGESRLGFIAPHGGTTISPQPIAMFRGASNPELATRFIEFILSLEGQKLWGLKAGAPGGPEKMALRNMPLRRDYYVPEILVHAADPELRPLEPGAAFIYEPKYTAELFSSIRFLIRAMCIDPHIELKEAWHELIAHKFPPRATAAFNELPDAVSYAAVKAKIAPLLKSKDSVAVAKLARELSEHFRGNYLKARDLAREGK